MLSHNRHLDEGPAACVTGGPLGFATGAEHIALRENLPPRLPLPSGGVLGRGALGVDDRGILGVFDRGPLGVFDRGGSGVLDRSGSEACRCSTTN